ncbi:aspartate aminotransferase family protein [Bacillus sp. ISL-40]|uniref:aspartate aminotransferase family protein n=1 Tax=unclassified Bacillus (in: firmicutes) TaxID=185979 RepID=UPI001BEA5057|nr:MULTISPECIES: aspartate aminotransferase family protein [unclassified Bacillus (in: firmicutes)]MBT2699293.1 aspartate aminotransferase family protein [Bacillus sp. ISL-40]MBT2723439.1 aspartate aminotransferase family protein [Bacillus sp. ISL-46]MBT2739847.1 aspartate aminotransferase family protein [Bacillus sp. ISL-77]
MDHSFLIKPILDDIYPVIDYGKGIYLFDMDGKRYLDAASGAVTANIGHGVTEIIEAMDEQAKKVSFVYRSQFTSEAAENLAKKIANMLSGDLNWCFFVNSGSEATETAMKMAIQYWQEKGVQTKTKVLSRWVSYHGITLGALSMSGHTGRRARFVPLLEDFPVINPPYCYRCPYNLEAPNCGYLCAHELETAIKRIGAEQIAAFIAEPVIGAAGGAIAPPKDYYKVIKKICEDYDILFIADEVMTGCGRTGTMLASEQWGINPDIVALGKGMGAGYAPIAAAIATEKVIEPIMAGTKVVMSGHTLSANPQACATALAVLEYLEQNNIMQEVESKGAYLRAQLEGLKPLFTFIGDIRGKGLLLGIEFVQQVESKTPYPRNAQITQRIVALAKEKGLLVYPAGAGIDGINGDSIIISPPLTITQKEMEELVHLLKETFEDLSNQLNEGKG